MSEKKCPLCEALHEAFQKYGPKLPPYVIVWLKEHFGENPKDPKEK